VLESSNDGTHFLPINEKLNSNNSLVINDGYNDRQLSAKKYYRLKILNKDGNTEYSSVVVLTRSTLATNIIISPNPASTKMVVSLTRANAGKVTFSIYDMAGKKILQQNEMLAQGTSAIDINNLATLSAGSYVLKIEEAEQVTAHKIIIRK